MLSSNIASSPMAAVNFALDTNFKGSKADNVKRVQIHVAEAQGLSLKGSARSSSAYVTIESPGFGTLHQTSSVGKGKKLVWHENTRIVELKPTTPIKFTVKRQGIWPMTHHVLGSTDTYDLGRLIEMQGKNDRETCVTLSLNLKTQVQTKPSIVVNIRDLDTREDIQLVREHAAYFASSRRKEKERETDCSESMSDESYSLKSRRSLTDSPPLTGMSSTFSSVSPSSSPPTSPSIRYRSPPATVGAVAATSVMSTAVASPNTSPATSSSHVAAHSTAFQKSTIDNQ